MISARKLLILWIAVGVIGVISQGCGKKEAPATVAPPAATDSTASHAAQASSFHDVPAAIKAGAYSDAVDMALRQPPPDTDAQAAEQARQMQQLQHSLAAGVAAGDPNAIAAAQKLRAAHMH